MYILLDLKYLFFQKTSLSGPFVLGDNFVESKFCGFDQLENNVNQKTDICQSREEKQEG